MVQTRDLLRFDGRKASFDSLEEFLSAEEVSELVSISYGEMYLDILALDRGFELTVVTFTGSVSLQDRKLPSFEGIQWCSNLPVNVICISDPLLQLGLEAGWYLGAKTIPLQRDLIKILNRLLEVLNLPEQLIFLGASSGGFAALYFSAQFPTSTVLALNPQTNLARVTSDAAASFLECAWGVKSFTDIGATTDLKDCYSSGFSNEVFYVQNVSDGLHRDLHLAKWMRAIPEHSPNLHLWMHDWGKGHQPVPSSVVQEILSLIVRKDSDGLAQIGFVSSPSKLEPARQLEKARSSNGC